METGFCELIGVGMRMRMETLLTHELGWFEHFNHPDTAHSHLAYYIASCVLVECVLLYFLCFIMNGS